MKKILTALCLMTASLLNATTATVDVMAIVKKLPSYEKLEADLQKEVSIATNKLQDKKEQLEAKISEIETKGETMSQQRLTRLRREATSLKRELSFMEEDLQNNLVALEQDMKATLMKDAQNAIKDFAKTNELEVIVSNELVIFSSSTVDVTNKIIETLG